MSRAFPWHSRKSGVYHNNTDCEEGRAVARADRVDGTGGKPLCRACASHNRKERSRPARGGRPDRSAS